MTLHFTSSSTEAFPTQAASAWPAPGLEENDWPTRLQEAIESARRFASGDASHESEFKTGFTASPSLLGALRIGWMLMPPPVKLGVVVAGGAALVGTAAYLAMRTGDGPEAVRRPDDPNDPESGVSLVPTPTDITTDITTDTATDHDMELAKICHDLIEQLLGSSQPERDELLREWQNDLELAEHEIAELEYCLSQGNLTPEEQALLDWLAKAKEILAGPAAQTQQVLSGGNPPRLRLIQGEGQPSPGQQPTTQPHAVLFQSEEIKRHFLDMLRETQEALRIAPSGSDFPALNDIGGIDHVRAVADGAQETSVMARARLLFVELELESQRDTLANYAEVRDLLARYRAQLERPDSLMRQYGPHIRGLLRDIEQYSPDVSAARLQRVRANTAQASSRLDKLQASVNTHAEDAQAIDVARHIGLMLSRTQALQLAAYEYLLRDDDWRHDTNADLEGAGWAEDSFAESCPPGCGWDTRGLDGALIFLDRLTYPELVAYADGSMHIANAHSMRRIEQALQALSFVSSNVAGRDELQGLLERCMQQIDGPISTRAALVGAVNEILAYQERGLSAVQAARMRGHSIDFDRAAIEASTILELPLRDDQEAFLTGYLRERAAELRNSLAPLENAAKPPRLSIVRPPQEPEED